MGVIVGKEGELRVSYQRAALLYDWELTFSQDTIGKISIEIIAKKFKSDDYWITKELFDACFWLGQSWWVWKRANLVSRVPFLELRAEGNPEAFSYLR